MQASKAADTYCLSPGHDIQQADARQACAQSVLGGTPTWVRLPREAWPASWAGMRDPVSRYGCRSMGILTLDDIGIGTARPT